MDDYIKIRKLSKRGIEVWRWIPGYRGYYKVSSLGRVKSVTRRVPHSVYGTKLVRARYRSVSKTKFGHHQVSLVRDGKSKTFLVHFLVIRTFKGKRPKGLDTRHLDGNATNNCLYNLVYGTRLQNVADAMRHGTAAVEERNGQAILTRKQVEYIKKQLATGLHGIGSALARKFRVSPMTISDIKTQRNWSRV